MDRLTHDDGSFRVDATKQEVIQILEYFEDRTTLSDTQVEFTDVLRHTFGDTPESIMEPTGSPFDDWTETIVGSAERLNSLGKRLNELSEEVAKEDETYSQVYQETAEFIFAKLEEVEF